MSWLVLVGLVLMIPLVAAVLDSPLGRALAARVERRGLAGEEGLGTRGAALEAETERLSTEVQRLQEESEILRRLLEGRRPANQLPSSERRNGGSAGAAFRPLRPLGGSGYSFQPDRGPAEGAGLRALLRDISVRGRVPRGAAHAQRAPEP